MSKSVEKVLAHPFWSLFDSFSSHLGLFRHFLDTPGREARERLFETFWGFRGSGVWRLLYMAAGHANRKTNMNFEWVGLSTASWGSTTGGGPRLVPMRRLPTLRPRCVKHPRDKNHLSLTVRMLYSAARSNYSQRELNVTRLMVHAGNHRQVFAVLRFFFACS